MSTVLDTALPHPDEVTPHLWFTDLITLEELHNQRYTLQNRLYVAERHNAALLATQIEVALQQIDAAIIENLKKSSAGVRFHE